MTGVTPPVCAVCRVACSPPLRCSRCRQVIYCSGACQKMHWPDHRLLCTATAGQQRPQKRPPTHKEAQRAWEELQKGIWSLSRDEAGREYEKAVAHANRIAALEPRQAVETENLAKPTRRTNSFLPSNDEDALSHKSRTTRLKKESKNTTTKPPDGENTVGLDSPNQHSPPPPQPSVSVLETGWKCLMEQLPNVCSLIVTLRRQNSNPSKIPPKEALSVHVHCNENDKKNQFCTARVAIRSDCHSLHAKEATLLQIQHLPLQENHQGSLSVYENDCIIIRFSTRHRPPTEMDAVSTVSPSTQPNDYNALRCRSCAMNLVQFTPMLDGSESIKPSRQPTLATTAPSGHASSPISEVMALPEGHWDEIADYLSCYDDPSVKSFTTSSTTAIRGSVLENATMVVMHADNVSPAITTLAVSPYGEEEDDEDDNEDDEDDNEDDEDDNEDDEDDDDNDNDNDKNDDEKGSADYVLDDALALDSLATATKSQGMFHRGSRLWAHNGLSGDTACCSQCCAKLGYQSTTCSNTFWLFKHRLGMATNTPFTNTNTAASFLAGEMVRYAESMAIFTFVVANSGGQPQPQHDARATISGAPLGSIATQSSKNQCILLKIVSWDSSVNLHSGDNKNNNTSSFGKVAKVVFERSDDVARKRDMESPMAWTWGGVDLCCPPTRGRDEFSSSSVAEGSSRVDMPQDASASVRIAMDNEEWLQLWNHLVETSSFLSKTVSDATIHVKLGPSSVQGHARLSYLPVPA